MLISHVFLVFVLPDDYYGAINGAEIVEASKNGALNCKVSKRPVIR